MRVNIKAVGSTLSVLAPAYGAPAPAAAPAQAGFNQPGAGDAAYGQAPTAPTAAPQAPAVQPNATDDLPF